MEDFAKKAWHDLAQSSATSVRVVETTRKVSSYNCFGEKIGEDITTESEMYFWKDEPPYGWVKGLEQRGDV